MIQEVGTNVVPDVLRVEWRGSSGTYEEKTGVDDVGKEVRETSGRDLVRKERTNLTLDREGSGRRGGTRRRIHPDERREGRGVRK